MIDGFCSEFLNEAENYAAKELGYEKQSYPSIESMGLHKQVPMTETQLFYMLKHAYLAGRNRFQVKGLQDLSIKEFIKS